MIEPRSTRLKERLLEWKRNDDNGSVVNQLGILFVGECRQDLPQIKRCVVNVLEKAMLNNYELFIDFM